MPRNGHIPPAMRVPQLVVLDFDRMLSDVEASTERLYAIATDFNIDVTALEAARRNAEQDGGSFAPLNIIKELLDERALRLLVGRYKALKGYEVLFPDVAPFIRRLEAAGIPHMVLTYGVSELWQLCKVRASAYAGPVEILDHADKGRHIASWRDDAGVYVFEDKRQGLRFEAESVCLLDDKAKAFADLPEDCTGFWVKRSEVLLPNQRGSIPEDRVESIYGLAELAVNDRRLARFRPSV